MADLARSRTRMSLARRGARADRDEPKTGYLAFRLGEDVYAGPVSLIREILKPPPLTPVPRAPHQILGIVSVRGQLVTVIDLRRRLHLEEAPISRRSRILLVDAPGGEVMGLYVDEVLQVYRLAESEIEPAQTALGGEVAGYIAGIARPAIGSAATAQLPGTGVASTADASVVILLDLRAILAS